MKPEATSRLVNAKESETWYPWMAYCVSFRPKFQKVDGETIKKDRKPKWNEKFLVFRGACTGSIISSR